jgi:hypothetical protein
MVLGEPSHALGLEHVAQGLLERPAPGVDRRGLGSRLPLDLAEPRHDLLVGLFPGDTLEIEAALGAPSPHRVAQAVL